MTPEQYQAAVAELTQVDTELAALNQSIVDHIAKARESNDACRTLRNQVTAINTKAAPLREAVAQATIELKRQQAEKAKAEAAERAKVEAEARAKVEAAKAAEQSEVEKLRAELAELKAKG